MVLLEKNETPKKPSTRDFLDDEIVAIYPATHLTLYVPVNNGLVSCMTKKEVFEKRCQTPYCVPMCFKSDSLYM